MNIAKTFASVSVAAALATASAAFAGDSGMVLNIPQTGFGASPVLAWSWGVSNSGTTHVGGGGGVGRSNFQDLALSRASDAQSSKLLQLVATGTHLPTVTLQDGAVAVTMTDVLVTSYSVGEGADKKSAPTENITLNFAKVRYQVNGVGTEFDLTTNTSQ